MTTITRDELQSLAAASDPACASLYLPLNRSFPHGVEDATRFRALVDRAVQQLTGQGVPAASVSELVQPARDLQADATFWKNHGAEGLAVLFCPGTFRKYTLPYRCPEMVDVGTGFYLNPLLRALNWDAEFHLLALSPKRLRLFQCRRTSIVPAPLPAGMPASMGEALAGTEIEKSLQYHTSAGFGGAHIGMAHGHGDPKDDAQKLLLDYFQIVSRHLERALNGSRWPLILAAVDYYHPMFRSCFKSPILLDGGVIGSADELTEQELLERARPEIDRWQRANLQRLLDRHRKQVGSDHAADGLPEILPAAAAGRVEAVIAAQYRGEQGDGRIWGRFDPEQGTVTIHERRQPGDIELVDAVLHQTLLHRGDVYVVPAEELPEGKSLVAILRW